MALSENPKDRGNIVAEGGGKVSDRFGNHCKANCTMTPLNMATILNTHLSTNATTTPNKHLLDKLAVSALRL